MSKFQSIAKDTAIYGLPSIVGRFLNYLLVPLYTHVIPVATGGYGVITNFYAYTALILVILTFGMETTFFRFANKEGENPHTVFSTTFIVVTGLSVVFLALVAAFIQPIGHALGYDQHHEYILMMSLVVALDAVQAIPFCHLRYQQKALKFAALKMLFMVLNIGLNLLFFLLLGKDDVFYVFALNLICTSTITFFFLPEFLKVRWHFDVALLRRMLSYSWPILVLGIAGILNQAADKMIFPHVYPDREQGVRELAVYGGCVKIAMIMAMITQAFRYAYEPFVFAQGRGKGQNETYALGMKYFLIFTLLAFLCVMGWLPLLRYMVGSDYWEGLRVVPIVMAAEIMMGIYFNLSFWYKLIDRTIYGAWFSLAGCTVLLAVNLWGIPRYSYMACAWGGFAGYATAMLLSYFIGQKKNPIPYPLKDMAMYTLFALVLYLVMEFVPDTWPVALRLAVNTLLILIFLFRIVRRDLPLRSLPLIGKYFR